MSGLPEVAQVPRAGLRESRAEAEGAMRARVDDLMSTVLRGPDAEELRRYLLEIASGDHLAWAVATAGDRLRAARDTHGPRSSVRMFPEWLVAVTACSPPLQRTLRSFQGGYLGLLAGLTREAYGSRDGRHIAHWVVCPEDGGMTAFLTVIPNHRVTGAPLLLSRTLLAPEEQRLAGLMGGT